MSYQKTVDYPCTYHAGVRCLHGSCRLAQMSDQHAAQKLRRNWEAKDYARNWGLMLYDPRIHGRDTQRRTALAKLLQLMRKGEADYALAVVTGFWAGALMH